MTKLIGAFYEIFRYERTKTINSLAMIRETAPNVIDKSNHKCSLHQKQYTEASAYVLR
jgi:hypothetical protein